MTALEVFAILKSWAKSYVIPTGAVPLPLPRSELASDVQNSLAKADTTEGVPAGGTTGQVLTKSSNANFDIEWATQSSSSAGETAGLEITNPLTESISKTSTNQSDVNKEFVTSANSHELAISNVQQDIQGLEGRIHLLSAYDFGLLIDLNNIDDPNVQLLLNTYALTVLNLSDVSQIPNFIGVRNLYINPQTGNSDETLLIFNSAYIIPDNNYIGSFANITEIELQLAVAGNWAFNRNTLTRWDYDGTVWTDSLSDPRIPGHWIVDGKGTIVQFAAGVAGVITGTLNPGNGSKDGYIEAQPDGTGKVIGLENLSGATDISYTDLQLLTPQEKVGQHFTTYDDPNDSLDGGDSSFVPDYNNATQVSTPATTTAIGVSISELFRYTATDDCFVVMHPYFRYATLPTGVITTIGYSIINTDAVRRQQTKVITMSGVTTSTGIEDRTAPIVLRKGEIAICYLFTASACTITDMGCTVNVIPPVTVIAPTAKEMAFVPDYMNMESTSLINVNNGSWTADRDGFVSIRGTSSSAGGRATVTINGGTAATLAMPTTNDHRLTPLWVKAGWVVNYNQTVGTFSAVSCYFIPPTTVIPTTATEKAYVPNFGSRVQKVSAPNQLTVTWTADAPGWVYREAQVTNPSGNYVAYSATLNGVLRYINTWQGQTSGGTPQNTGPEFWVNTGDVVQFIAAGITSGQLTKNVIWYVPSKTIVPDTINVMRLTPELWTPGTEYNFGGGVFGQRFTGNIVGAVDTEVSTSLLTGVSSYHIIDNGGWFESGSGTGSLAIHATIYSSGAILYTSGLSVSSAGAMNLSSFSHQARVGTTSNRYDVWVVYTKV